MPAPLALLLHAEDQISWTTFTVHPSTVVGILAFAGLYEWRARRAGRAERGTNLNAGSPRSSQRIAFYSALVVLFLSLNGWLHDLSDSFLFRTWSKQKRNCAAMATGAIQNRAYSIQISSNRASTPS